MQRRKFSREFKLEAVQPCLNTRQIPPSMQYFMFI